MKSNHITRKGFETLQNELGQLWNIERPKVTDAVHEAAKNGDRSENGDYIYGKRRLREIDRRVRYLTKRIENAVVVDYSPKQEGKVYFGAWVTLESDEDEHHTVRYRIVGSDELDPKQSYISVDSPMARAMIGKSIGDTVIAPTPSGDSSWIILSISYEK